MNNPFEFVRAKRTPPTTPAQWAEQIFEQGKEMIDIMPLRAAMEETLRAAMEDQAEGAESPWPAEFLLNVEAEMSRLFDEYAAGCKHTWDHGRCSHCGVAREDVS